jgi:hypothetical protein
VSVFEPLSEDEAAAVNRLRVGALVWGELRRAGKPPPLQPGEVAPLFGLPVEIDPAMRLDAYELLGHDGEVLRSGTLFEIAEPFPDPLKLPPPRPPATGLEAVRRVAWAWSAPKINIMGV